MSLSPEELYLSLHDLRKTVDAQRTRIEVLEYFIKQQFPGMFAGETIEENADFREFVGKDETLKPIELNLGPLVETLRPDLDTEEAKEHGYTERARE